MTVDCFTCPEPANYAAIALQLQATARQAETCLYAAETQLRAAVNPQSFVFTSTVAQNVSANVSTPISGGTNTMTFTNMPLTSGAFPTQPLGEGMWHVGVCFNAIATGAVTANSYRLTTIRVRDQSQLVTGPDRFNALGSIFEPNNGTGVDVTFSTVVALSATDIVQLRFLHNNASSINLSVGLKLWATRLSDRFGLKVVT